MIYIWIDKDFLIHLCVNLSIMTTKEEKVNKYRILFIFCFLLAFGYSFYILGNNRGYTNGYKNGWEIGIEEMFFAVTDTISNILEKQRNDNSIVTELIIINPDTVTYFLSPKHIKIKNNE